MVMFYGAILETKIAKISKNPLIRLNGLFRHPNFPLVGRWIQ